VSILLYYIVLELQLKVLRTCLHTPLALLSISAKSMTLKVKYGN